MVATPEVLYHYTDTASMLSIISSLQLWATDANFLNDSNELQHGRAELCDALDAKRAVLGTSWRGVDLDLIRRHLLDGTFGDWRRFDSGGPYVSCFCEDGDLLSQWRGYAGGSGWAIGFSRKWLESVTYRPNGPSALRQVRYGRVAIEPMVTSVVRDLTVDPLARKGPSYAKALELCDVGLAGIKDGAFAEEREWRLVVQSAAAPGATRFRPGRLGLTPYVVVPFPKEAIVDLIVGPSIYPIHQKLAAERFLRSILGVKTTPRAPERSSLSRSGCV